VRLYHINLLGLEGIGIDILVSDPRTGKLYQMEVKTNFQNTRNKASVSKVHGSAVSGWIMSKKNETVDIPTLFYCFVNISKDTNIFKFYILPSKVVANYVKGQHLLWLSEKKKEGKKVKDGDMRIFRLGVNGEKYAIPTPIAEQYEDNWDFKA
jgi:hypothetical protein